MSVIIRRPRYDETVPKGIADAFAAAARVLAPAGTPIPDLKSLPEDAEWLRTHLAHRLERWVYTVEPIQFTWTTFDELYKQIDSVYRERLGDWRYPESELKWMREDEANAPRPEPKRGYGFNRAWQDRARKDNTGSIYNEALTLCVLEDASHAAFYLTKQAGDMALGLPGVGYAMADALAYSVQTCQDAHQASERWLDEANRLRRVHGLNGGHS